MAQPNPAEPLSRAERAVVLRWFSDRMKARLSEPRNEAKGNWRSDTMRALWHRCSEELNELFEAIDGDSPYDPSAVIEKAVDVASFAMFIADCANQPER